MHSLRHARNDPVHKISSYVAQTIRENKLILNDSIVFLILVRAPTSAQLTPGTVANPSRLALGWTTFKAAWKCVLYSYEGTQIF